MPKASSCFISSNGNVFCLMMRSNNPLSYCFCLTAVCLQQQLAICMDNAVKATAPDETQMPLGRKDDRFSPAACKTLKVIPCQTHEKQLFPLHDLR